MKLIEAIVKSGRVKTVETESKKSISRYVKLIMDNNKIKNVAWIKTPRGIYYFFSSKRKIDLKDDYTVSIARESYNGKRENVENIMTNDLVVLGNWMKDKMKNIIDKDFKDRKYIMPRYWI